MAKSDFFSKIVGDFFKRVVFFFLKPAMRNATIFHGISCVVCYPFYIIMMNYILFYSIAWQKLSLKIGNRKVPLMNAHASATYNSSIYWWEFIQTLKCFYCKY